MRVCIIRNAESKTNAAIFRVIDALLDSGNQCLLLTRSRYNKDKGILKKEHNHNGHSVDNYEINIKVKAGRGLLNIFQLIYYQFIVFMWIMKNNNKYDIIIPLIWIQVYQCYLHLRYQKEVCISYC